MPVKKRIALLLLLAGALGQILACSASQDEQALLQRSAGTDTSSVRVVTVKRLCWEGKEEAFESFLYAKKDAFIVAKVGGMIRETYFDLGDRVSPGDTLAKIEDELLCLEFELARNAFDKARHDFERYQILYDKNLISESEYEQAKLRREQTDIERRCALERYRQSRLIAPFSGVVVSNWARVGQVAAAGDSLFHITQRFPVYTRVFLTEEEHTRLSTEGRVRVQPEYGAKEAAWGTVVRKSPTIDPVAGTIELIVRIDPQYTFCRPGMAVKVFLEPESPSTTLAVSKSAFPNPRKLSSLDTTRILLYRNGVTEERSVHLGRDLDSLWEIKGEIESGDSVVAFGLEYLGSGQTSEPGREIQSGE